MEEKVINIKFRGIGLECKLSNLYPYVFMFEEVEYSSIEAFFACLRIDKEDKQGVNNMWGKTAWKVGHNFDWKIKQQVNYKGKIIDRHSEDYQKLITAAYDALYTNPDFQDALRKSNGYVLKHSMGKSDKRKSLLTEREFIGQLNRLRNKQHERKFFNLFDFLERDKED